MDLLIMAYLSSSHTRRQGTTTVIIMNAVNFQKWTTENLLPNIPQNSVVIMDNAAYHSTQIDRKPTMSSLKIHMQEWLTRKNVPFNESARKCDLMNFINQQKVEKQYRIDETIKAAGQYSSTPSTVSPGP